MPIYSYECQDCKQTTEVVRSIREDECNPTKEQQQCSCVEPHWLKILFPPINRYRFFD